MISLYLATRSVSLNDVWAVLRTVKAGYIFLIFCSVNLNTLVKALRWYAIVKGTGKPIRFQWIFYAFTIGQMMNWIYPARMGDVSRVVLLGRKETGEAFAAGTLILEKLLDVVYFLGLIIILPWLLAVPAWLKQPMQTTLFLSIGGLLLVVVLMARGKIWIARILEFNLPIPERAVIWVKKFLISLESGLQGLDVLRRRKDFILLNILTIVVWLTASANVFWSFRALAFPLGDGLVPLTATLLVVVSLQLGIAVPAVPGRIGVFELVCVLALSVFALPESLSLGFGILLHSLVMFPIILVGLVSLILMSVGKTKGTMKDAG